MRRIKLICFGKLKEPHWRAACGEYEKRLGAYCKLETAELTPLRTLDEEAQLAQSKIGKQASIAALCVEGETLSSEQFAAWLDAQPNEIEILIGSSDGMSEDLKAQAQLRLSLSPMTLPHQLARVMLLEQIYRAFQINTGGKYHK